MINSKKKGFTIVELVIVIAVVAILAAVLIPTFSNLVKKANLSADQVAVKNMNTVLMTEFPGESPAGLKEVIDALDENGYDIDALDPLTDGYYFVWDNNENKILLVETVGEGQESLESGTSYINEEVASFEKLQAAVLAGSDVTLTEDITAAGEIKIPANTNVTLNLGGKSYTTTTLNSGVNAQSEYIKIEAGATLTIENGTFNGRGILNNGTLIIKEGTVINAIDINGGGCIRNKPGATVTIEGGEFNVVNYIKWDETNYGGAAGIHNDGGTVVIKNGKFTSNTAAYLINSKAGTITIENGTFSAYRGALSATDEGKIVVNGGSFEVTNGEDSGWIAYASTGEIVINAGSYKTVTNQEFYGNVVDNR